VKVGTPASPAAGEPPIAPPVESQPQAGGERKGPLPPPQRYVPMPAKQNVFKKKK